MSSLVTITSKFYDRSGARVMNLNVKSRYQGSLNENSAKTDENGLFIFQASPNRTIEILAKPPNTPNYIVVKTISSSVQSSSNSPVDVKLPKTIDEYRQGNSRTARNGLVMTVFKIVDSQGKVMANFPVQTRPKGKRSFERSTDHQGIVEVQSSPNRDIELLVLTSKDEFVLKSSINSANGTQLPILIKLDEAYANFVSTSVINLVDRDGSDYVVKKTYVEMIFLDTGKKNTYVTSNGKLPVRSMIGQKLQFTALKPDGKPLDPVIYIAKRIKEKPLKLHLDVDVTHGSTDQNEPNIDVPLNADSCGLEFRGKVHCTRYNGVFGPLYKGLKKFSNYNKWDELIASNRLNNNDKIVLMGVAPNEGNFDAVQSYDSEIITAGAMQKTVNSSGTGELPEQIYKFKKQYPSLYKSLFENCGWVVVKVENTPAKVVYNGLSNSNLKKLMRENCSKDNFGKKINCAPIESMIAGVSHPLFIDLQVIDFIDRLKIFMNKTPIKRRAKNKQDKTTFYDYKIKDYIKSNLGKATVLDHSINRPGHVTRYLGEALNNFFKNNKGVSDNPNDWGANHSRYENQILDFYGVNRGNMTHSAKRYNNTKNLISELEKK